MQRIGGDRGVFEPPSQFVAEHDVGKLGLAVRPCSGVGLLALEVAEVDAPGGMRVGGDRNHPGRRALQEPVQQQVGEQKRREMVEGEGAFESVYGDVAGIPVPADIVDQHIDPRKAVQYLLGQPPYFRLGGQVRDEQVHLPASGRTDLASRVLGAYAISAGDRQVCTHPGQTQRGRPADAARGTGDQHCPAGHRLHQGRSLTARVRSERHGSPGFLT